MKYQIINGEILKKENALIPTNDLGMLRAYGVFDFFRILKGKPVFLPDHIERLFRSMNIFDLELEFEKHHIKEMVLKLVEKNEMENAGFRIVVTGGFSENGYSPSDANFYMMMHHLPYYDPRCFGEGIKLITTPYLRDMPGVKTLIYIQSIHFAKKMKKEGALEVLYHWKGRISECSRSNIFFVDQNDRVITTKNALLKGITRRYTLKLAEEKFAIQKRKVILDELPHMKEAFITSSTKGIMPVSQIDGLVIGNGQPGPVTKELMADFQTLIDGQQF